LTYIKAYSSATSSERPLYPSVEVLLHINNLKASDVTATGPQGRLLKGDVLAHLGKIPAEAPESLSKWFTKNSHLDLSNIKPAAPAPEKPAQAVEPVSTEALPEEYELALPINLKPVLKLQHQLKDTLGHTPPLSELLARAIDLANANLPVSSTQLSADELFDQIVGATSSHAQKFTNGKFVPAINAALEPIPVSEPVDVYDELIAPSTSRPARRPIVPQSLAEPHVGAVNDFSLVVPEGSKKRALIFLQRMKSILEVEPGRLVL
jgi:hypothetical protein